MTTATPGTLVLVPNTLDLGTEAGELQDVLPAGVLRRAAGLRHWIAENAKTTRAFLKRVDAVVPLAQPLQAISIVELPRPRKGGGSDAVPGAEQWQALLSPAMQGDDVGLISEAGLPAVADPGAAVVDAAHRLGVPVQALAGASSLMLALAASGLNGQSFAFVGYLPVEAAARAARLKELESLSRRSGQTQLVIETPYRNTALLNAMAAALSPTTQLSVSCGLTLANGWTRTQAVAQWRKAQTTLPDRLPAVFAFLA
ncbi:SAM-dependent methyltransferase [Ideonella sp. BN130291]|uniref:SAM-dependent methyltransferase n=1 Tax=Ideonella sp. BN130291 TaxID=3112940 RepID=UPI002E269136|nr:SAM-dependent methyltransferase [Ideonella sp. BN130291]